MKKLVALLVLITMMTLPMAFAQQVAVPANTFLNAQEELENAQDVKDAGITPDSGLYGLAVWLEKLQLAFTTDPTNHAILALKQANQHLAEAKVMARKGNLAARDRALDEEGKSLDEVDKVKPKLDEDHRQHVETELEKHLTVLNAVKEKLEAKGLDAHGVENAITKSSQVLTNAKVPNANATMIETPTPSGMAHSHENTAAVTPEDHVHHGY